MMGEGGVERRRRLRRWVRLGAAGGALALVLGFSAGAAASPWTLPNDDLSVHLDADFQFTEEQFLLDGTRQDFSLNGNFKSSALRVTTRYGLTDRLELGGTLRLKHVTYEADPLVLLTEDPEGLDEEVPLSEARARTLDFSTNNAGVGDVDLFGRYNFFRDAGLLLTTETLVRLPTGYAAPEGTFEDDSFADATVQDDVTLGDGQANLRQSLLFGAFISPTRTFVRADLGYELRFGRPGDQGIAALKAGQLIGDKVVVFAGARGVLTLREGEPIGKTFVALDPDVPASEFLISNIAIEDSTLDRDYLQVEGGLILRVGEMELQAAYSRVLLGRNIPVINSVAFSTAVRLPNATGEALD